MNNKLFKINTNDKLIHDELSKLSFVKYCDKSRIDGYIMYEIDLVLLHRYFKIRKIQGKDSYIYNKILNNLTLVSIIEDHIQGFFVSNPTKTSILTPTII